MAENLSSGFKKNDISINMQGYKKFYNDNFRNKGGSSREFGNIEGSHEYVKRFNLNQNSAILDIGCNIGSLANRLYADGYLGVFGIDISNEAIAFGKEKYPALAEKLLSYGGGRLPFENESFDVVLMFDSIEHIPEVEKFLKNETKRVLKNGGLLIFQTPNKYMNILWSYVDARSIFTKWWIEHCSLQTASGLRKILENSGFSEVKVEKGLIHTEYNSRKMRDKFGKLGGIILKILEKLPLAFYPNLFGSAIK
jgi:2-polyprenyl-3-methyl-5-hydroxy-6-metoxy-1,4-benzoquinol methylase